MTDQYREQYKKETEQIHAPAALIAKTKAAMREEETRIRREFKTQTAGSETGKMSTASGQTAPARDRKYGRHFDFRKWVYPLTAAAALLILVSVSLTMRGLKSGNMDSSPAYEEMAVEMESAEMSGGEDLDAGMAATGAAADSEGSAETAEEAFADEMMSAEADMAAAPAAVAGREDLSESVAAADDVFSEKSEPKEVEQGEQQRKLNNAEKSLAEDEAAPADSGAQSGGAADAENITIEKVIRRPDFCGYPDTETRIFEGETFQLAKEENEWAAYVETEDGDRYVIRGEAEDAETFLEAGYQKLLEIK